MKLLIQPHVAFRWFLALALSGYAISAWNAEAGDATVQPPSLTGEFESLRSLLETRGWRVERTPDGATLLFPLQNAPQAAATGEATVQPPSMTDDFESLRSLLETRGWRVERTPDGATLLFPLLNTPQAAATGDATVQPPSMTGDFESLRSLLETRGWRVERTPDGSTLLFPLRNTPQEQEPAPASITLTVSPEDMQQLRELLEDYSWNLVQDGGNALHLAAPAQPHALSTATKADCAEVEQESLHTAGITLPVNTDEEAWLISANWLWASGFKELDVGNIRDINWTYIVQIVDLIPPHRLRNELIINKRSGQLLALY